MWLKSLALTLNRNVIDHLHFIRQVLKYEGFSVVSFGLMRDWSLDSGLSHNTHSSGPVPICQDLSKSLGGQYGLV